jgi:copper(I)-binding protein
MTSAAHRRFLRRRRLIASTTVVLFGLPVVAGAVLALRSSTADDPPLISLGTAFAAASDDISAVYLTIRNEGGDDRLVEARSPVADRVSLMAGDGGTMELVSSLDIPTGITVLEPGGSHIMVEDLTEPLEAGATVPVELTFERSGTGQVQVEVLPWEDMLDRIEGIEGSEGSDGAVP